jgi:hypothetical protein
MNENNYGFTFNNITIRGFEFNKNYKNLLGKNKINNEIKFYLYINKNELDFPMPELINYDDGNITIRYIENSFPLTNKIISSNITEYINKIKSHFCIIHNIQKKVSQDVIKRDLNIELNIKIMNRFNEYDWDSNLIYKSIKSVNNVKIKNIYYYTQILEKKIIQYFETRNYYNLIHGDTHLGNILLDKNDNIYFIDPRGYFGESSLFGIYEYDYAKLLFGLSGYSVFDNMIIDEINVKDNNIEINFIKEYEYIFESNLFDGITILLCLSIWLSNNSCFSNINKKITSLMISCYYCEKYLDKF